MLRPESVACHGLWDLTGSWVQKMIDLFTTQSNKKSAIPMTPQNIRRVHLSAAGGSEGVGPELGR